MRTLFLAKAVFVTFFTFITLPMAFAQELSQVVSQQMRAIQAEKTARTPTERKLDSQLLYLFRESIGLRAVAGAPTVRSRVERELDGRVKVEISAQPSGDLAKAISDAGGAVIYQSPRWMSVSALAPPSALAGLAARADVKRIAPASKAITHTGPVTNEADVAHNGPGARALFGVDGSGVKVGVISNSDDHSEDSVANGELPSFTVLPGRDGRPASGEGTAMSEIIADLAPGADIYFASALPSMAFFADSILLLREAGARIIVDDISYLAEWQFQDDIIAQAVNEVVADGAIYLSSAGNEGSLKKGTSSTWEGNFVDGGTNNLLPGGTVHKFKGQTYNTLTNGEDVIVVFQWSDEAHTSANDYDLYILDADGANIVTASDNTQDGDDEPLEIVFGVQPGERIVIFKAASAERRYLRLIAPCCGAVLAAGTAGQTIGHASTANTITVGASDASAVVPGQFTTVSPVEDFTSDGPRKLFYYPDGAPITPGKFLANGGLTLKTPALTAGDGGATSVPGFAPFYGTSAAAPAAAAIGALVWSRAPNLTGAQVRSLLEASCLDIESRGHDNISGNGILMADLALQRATASDLLDDLIAFVESLPIAQKLKNNLLKGLTAAQEVVIGGKTAKACLKLRRVSNIAQSQRGKKLTTEQADQLIEDAEQVRLTLGCS